MNHEVIVETLKRVLKKKKISYQRLAEEIGMSESGLKKLFTANDISLNRLTQILDALGLSLPDLIDLTLNEEIKNVDFSEQQTDALLADPILLRVLWRMSVEKKTENETIQLEKISQKKLKSSLLKLENLDLIKIRKFGNITSFHGDLYRWANKNKLTQKINKDWSRLTLENSLKASSDPHSHQLSYLELTEESQKKLFMSIQTLVDDFARLSRSERAKHSKTKLKPMSLLVATMPKGFLD